MIWAAVAVLAPLAVAVLLMLVRPLRHRGRLAAGLSVSAALASLVGSLSLLSDAWQKHGDAKREVVTWLTHDGQGIAELGAHIDGISAPMLVVVSLVALCVQVFSLEYMHDEDGPSYGRYYTWQSLFLFSMQGLVIAPNLLQLFVCWELVGLCSYLLIGFWWKKAAAGKASLKAFWVTKFADLGLLLGLLLQFVVTGDFGWSDATVTALGPAATVVAGLYFLAVMGKSAQFPLHVWLPDAMEGPTPVSALLHAATMVAAGVYLIVRAYPIFQAAPDVMVVMACIGGFTAIFAACMAMVQTDIKKVLAYSTCSQLGYMVAALGGGSLMAGYFHLTTHAFFKALLFLAAGSIIHAVHSNELSDMGGLARKMTLTSATFIVGSAALAGVPFIFSGFYSKDLILEGLVHAAEANPVFWFPLICCVITVGLTAYYMGRVVVLALFGEPSEAASHAHEGGIAMSLPLVLLAVLAVVAGFPVEQAAQLYGVEGVHLHIVPTTAVAWIGIALAIGGIVLGVLVHRGGQVEAAALAPLGRLVRAGAVDRAWAGAYGSGLMGLSAVLAWFDRYIIDGLMNATAAVTLEVGERVRALQTGRITDYVYATALGVLVLAAVSQLAHGAW